MKNLFYFFIASMFFLLSCGEDDPVVSESDSLIGTWKLVQVYLSPGGATEWRDIEDGFEVTFLADSTFTNFNQCISGNFSINNKILSIECIETMAIAGLDFNYIMEFDGDSMELSNPLCIESCIERFERVQ